MPDETLLHPVQPDPSEMTPPAGSANGTETTPVVPISGNLAPEVSRALSDNVEAKREDEAVTTDDGEDVDFSRYKVGDLLDGLKIHHILLQYVDAIVFTTARGSIHFRQNLGEKGDAILVEFYRLTAKSNARLREAYGRQVNGLLGAALAEAISLPSNANVGGPFKAIDEFIDEHGPIKYILGATENWVVFVDKDGELVCDYPLLPEQAVSLLTEFYRLRQLGKASLRKHEIDALTHILGTELGIALQRTSLIEPAEAFSASRDFIQLRNESRMRLRYVAASFGAAVIFGLSAWVLLRGDLGLLLGCVGGVIGAAVSILQRSADLEIRRFLPSVQVILQGSVRVTLGVLFSLIVVAAARADLALGSFAASENALFIAGVVAGFSERFVPDLLTQIASDSPAKAK